jgi:ribosomal protein S18 acetylase RimI-like enzyme
MPVRPPKLELAYGSRALHGDADRGPTMRNTLDIIDATAEHGPAMEALLPLLASFSIPDRREPQHLWHGDRDILRQWLAGERPQSFIKVALTDDKDVAGLALVTMREEMLSHAPSAHLEVLVVDPVHQRTGLGARLTAAAESQARAQGATSMSLHVFASNSRARGLYAKLGFDEELIRCVKDL